LREYCFTIECEPRKLTARYASRELTFVVLGEPLLPAAAAFMRKP